MNYVQEANLIIIPVLTAIGFALKSAKFINDKYVPITLIILGAALGAFNGGITKSILEGVICAGIAMGIQETSYLIKKK